MPNSASHKLLAALLITNLIGAPAALVSQQSATEVPSLTLRANTRLVVVDVVVTDRKGQAVTGLTADDFTVEENGKKQKVSVFLPPASTNRMTPASPPPGVLSNRPENVGPAGVPIVLVLDAANSPFEQQAYARSEMLKYVSEQGHSGHPMAVLALTDRLHVLQQFTSDPQVLMTTIKNFKPESQILPNNLNPAPTAVPPGMEGATRGAGPVLVSTQPAVSDFATAPIAYNLERRTLITIDDAHYRACWAVCRAAKT